jgi:uncharacterized protein (TIGR02996 family)
LIDVADALTGDLTMLALTTKQLAAVRKAPADADLRKVYADALDEAGRDCDANNQREMARRLEAGEVFGNLLAVREERDGKAFARLFRLSTGKQLHYYRFPNAARRDRWIADMKAKEEAALRAKDAHAAAKRVGRENEVLIRHGGYDQTNIEWFQCVKVGPKSVTLRKIAGTRDWTGDMTGRTSPRVDEFVGEPFCVCFTFVTDSNGKAQARLPARFGCYYPWEGGALEFSTYA